MGGRAQRGGGGGGGGDELTAEQRRALWEEQKAAARRNRQQAEDADRGRVGGLAAFLGVPEEDGAGAAAEGRPRSREEQGERRPTSAER